jgi:ABC-type sugar transport system ATPase subunit
VVESTGSDVFVHVRLESQESGVHATAEAGEAGLPHELVARYPAGHRVAAGGQVDLHVDAERIQLFHPQSQERLVAPGERAAA